MGTYRKFSSEKKREIVEAALNGEQSKSAVCRKYEICFSQLQYWIDEYEHGRLDNEPTTEAGQYEKIARLEQMVGRQSMEIEFLKKAITYAREHTKKKKRLSKSTNSLLKQRDGGAN